MTDHKDHHRPTRTTSGFMARSEMQWRANTAELSELIGFDVQTGKDFVDFTRADKVFELTSAEERQVLFGLALSLAIRVPRKMFAAAVAQQRKMMARTIANALQRTQLERAERDLRQQPEGSAPHGN